MNDYFLYTGCSPLHLLDQLYENMSDASKYYKSPVGVLRCDVHQALKKELEKLINVPIADCGFLKTMPLQNYPIHTDAFRICAVNMPMYDPSVDFNSYVLNTASKTIVPIEYQKNYFTVLNVMKYHGVYNKSHDTDRVILSIGIKSTDYKTVIEKFNNRELFNDTLQKD